MRPAYWQLTQRGGLPREGVVVLGRKFCAGCGHWRHVADFGEYRGGPRARCRACTRIYQRNWHANATPEQRARINEYHRIWYEAKQREAGGQRQFYRRSVVDQVERVLLEPGPLLSEVERSGLTDLELQALSGISARAIYRLRTGGSRHIRLDVADKLAVGLGVPLALLYHPTEERNAA